MAQPERACKTTSLPPWHPARKTMKFNEVPSFIKHIYNLSVSYESVLAWAKRGVVRRSDGQRIYLKCRTFGRNRLVEKIDLLAFLKADCEPTKRKKPAKEKHD